MYTTNPPFFTIITATYNAAKTLPRLLNSLAEQTCQNFVWICQDGASSDSTMKIVEQWRGKISISVESCEDTGIYDAWNKAIAQENERLGKWVLFLGADDQLAAPDVLEEAMKKLKQVPNSILFGVGEIQSLYKDESLSLSTQTDIESVFKNRMLGTPLPHTGLFSRAPLFHNNSFDSTFKISADYDWMLKVWKNPNQAINLNMLVTIMAQGGISTLPENDTIILHEKLRICMRHFGKKKYYYAVIILIAFIEMKLSAPKKKLLHASQNNVLLRTIWNILRVIRKKLFP